MSGLRKRFVLDAVLTAMLVFEMLYQQTGNTLHELVGVLFFVTVIVHLVLSRKWFSSTSKGISEGQKMKPANRLRLILVIVLAIAFVALVVSSVVISNVLCSSTGFDLSFGAYAAWAAVHTVSSYALCAAVVAHLLVHWASAASAFRIPYNPQRRAAISTTMGVVATVGIAAIAVTAVQPVSKAIASVARENDADGNAASDNGKAAGEDMSQFQHKKDAYDKKGGMHSGGRKDNWQGEQNGSRSEEQAPAQPDGAAPNQPGAQPSDQSGTSDSSSICNLCRRRCALSAPECSRPYEAGLI